MTDRAATKTGSIVHPEGSSGREPVAPRYRERVTGHQLTVHLLGGFAVAVDGEDLRAERWPRRRPAELLKLLALAPDGSLPRDQIVDALWPDLSASAGGANVRKAVFHLRQLLGLPEICLLEGGRVVLLPRGVLETDVADFEERAWAALAGRDAERCREVAADYGPLLPADRDARWAQEPRDRLRGLHLDLLEAGEAWGLLLAEDPTRERAHHEVMARHLARGDRAAAIRQFGRARQVLREELGISPGPELTALYEEALEAEGAQAATPAMRARALLLWGGIHYERSELAEAEQAARDARALAVDARLGTELTEASELLGLTAYARGAWREVFAEEFLTMLAGSPELVPFLYDANMCMVEFALGEPDGLRAISEYAAGLLAEGERRDAPAARALGLLLRGEAGVLAGEPDGPVREDLLAAQRLHEELGAVTGCAVATERLAQLEAARGGAVAQVAASSGGPVADAAVAGAVADAAVAGAAADGHAQALAIAVDSAVAQHLVPWVYGGMVDTAADVDRATALLDEADAACADVQVCAPCAMMLRVAGARVSAARGDLDRARALIALAEPVARMWSGGPWHAALAEARAHALAASGDRAQVAAQLAAAAEQFGAAQRPREAARCRAGAAL